MCYADSKCNSKNDCFVSPDGEEGLETLLLFVSLGKKFPHFPFTGAVCAALRVIYPEKNKQFRKGSPENVVSQTNLKPGRNQMRNLVSDIASLLGQGTDLGLVTQSLSFFCPSPMAALLNPGSESNWCLFIRGCQRTQSTSSSKYFALWLQPIHVLKLASGLCHSRNVYEFFIKWSAH